MDESHRESARRIRARIERGQHDPSRLRSALLEVPTVDRDAWFDLALGLGELPDDGPELPQGCVPYLPCSVEHLLRVDDHAPVGESDVFVDIGSGAGRATAFVHLLSGASAIGVEIQPRLVVAARALAARLRASRILSLEGDAAALTSVMASGTTIQTSSSSTDGAIIRRASVRVCRVAMTAPLDRGCLRRSWGLRPPGRVRAARHREDACRSAT